MRKILSYVLIGLGAFLLMMAVLAYFWAPGVIERTPIDTDTTTRLDGSAEKLNLSTQELEDLDVKATSITRADTEKSTDDVVVFVSTTCLVIDENDVPDCVEGDDDRLVSAAVDIFATDRHTGEAVTDEKYFTADGPAKEGLVNKWPFHVEKKDYLVWDGLALAAFPAVYQGVEDVKGLEAYKFDLVVEEQDAEIADGVDGLYSMEKEYWVDPITGSIINQTQHEIRKLPDGGVVLDLNLAFIDDTVEEKVDEAESSGSGITLIETILPIVGLVGGLIALIAGVLLLRSNRRRSEREQGDSGVTLSK